VNTQPLQALLDDGFEALAVAARNRAGLPRIAYSADDLATLRARLSQRLPAALPPWNATLASGGAGPDFATLLSDLFALMAANLSAHADHRANEGFIRTAQERRSLMDLAALVDLQLGPGASATTLQAFIAKPGTEGTLPAGFQLTAPGTDAAGRRLDLIFETLAPLAVHASRNSLRVAGWNRSARQLRLRSAASAAQDSEALLDAAYSGLRAGTPLVLLEPDGRRALPLAMADASAGEATRVRWSAGSAVADEDLPLADLVIEGCPRQVAALAEAAAADEWPLGQQRVAVAHAAAFNGVTAVLVQSGALRFGARLLARNGTQLLLSRGAPVALRRSATEVLAGSWCGQTGQTIRPGAQVLPRSPAGHTPYPHTPQPGDMLLIEDSLGVEVALLADVSASSFTLAEPLLRGLRPPPYWPGQPGLIHFHAVSPDQAGTSRSALAPVLLQDLPGAWLAGAGGHTRLTLDRSLNELPLGSSVVLGDGRQWHAAELLALDTAGPQSRQSRVVLRGHAPGTLQVARLQVFAGFEHRMRVAGFDHGSGEILAGATTLDLVPTDEAADGEPQGLAPGTVLVLDDGNGAEGVVVTRVEAPRAADRIRPPAPVERGLPVPLQTLRWQVTLARPTERRYAVANLQVLGNVVPVSQGAGAAPELLGSGNPQTAPQRFTLARSPLAFVPDSTAPQGQAPALEVFVGGERWQRVVSLATSGPQDHHYRLEIDEQQRAHIVFGDGQYGATPPSGRDNLMARYRTGLGRAGNLGPGGLVKMVAPLPFIARSFNPLATSGGTERDGPAQARARAAHHVRTFDRAVTLQDHAELALAFGGVAAARADWVNEANPGLGAGARRRLVVTVASTGGQPLAPPQREALLAFLRERSAEPLRLAVRSHQPWPVHLRLEVTLQPQFTQDSVRAALLHAFGSAAVAEGEPVPYFAFERRALGAALVLSDVYRDAMVVPGVAHAHVAAFHAEGTPVAVQNRLQVPADAQATGGHAHDRRVGRLELALMGGLVGGAA
jgi:hypothetical protein